MKEALVLSLIVIALCALPSIFVGRGVQTSLETAANTRAINAAQQRRQQAEWHQVALRRARAIEPYRIAGGQAMWYWWSIFGIGAGATVIMFATGALCWWLIGFSRARVELVRREAYIIRIDPVTRQFPLLTYELAGVPRIYNPNTGSVIVLDTVRSEAPLLTTGSMATQLAGAIAEKAAPETAADIRPVLVAE